MEEEHDRVGGKDELAAFELELALGCQSAADHYGMARHARRGRAAAGRGEDPALLASAAGVLATAECGLGHITAGRQACDEATTLVDSLSDAQLGGRLDALLHTGIACQSLERLPDGLRHLERGRELSRAWGEEALMVSLGIGAAICMTWLGRLDSAAALAEETIAAARLAQEDESLADSLTLRCRIATLAGEPAVALRCGEEATELSDRRAHACYLAEARLEAGDPDHCRAELPPAAGGCGLPVIEPSYRPHFYEILTRAALEGEDIRDGERWAARAEGCLTEPALAGRCAEALLARAAVQLAAHRAGDAAGCALASAGAADEPGIRILAGRAHLLAGRALAQLGENRRAAEELERALGALDACGALRYADQAATELRRQGRRVPRRARGQNGERGAARLSARELEVAALVAEGNTNRQVAAALLLSEKTVENHLGRIFAKLGVPTRAALAGAFTTEMGEEVLRDQCG